jgi:hypothetical protein
VFKLSGGRDKEGLRGKKGFKGINAPVEVTLHAPQRASTLHAAFYFLSQNCTITSCETCYATAPATLASLLGLLQSGHGVSKLKLVGARAVTNEEVPQALSKILQSSVGLRKLGLIRLFGDEAPMKSVITSLAQCAYLSCVSHWLVWLSLYRVLPVC